MTQQDFEDFDEVSDAIADLTAELTVTRQALLETLRILRREFPDGFEMLVRNLDAHRATHTRMDDEATVEAYTELLQTMQVRSILK